jgi:hypothetical protein
MRIGPDEKKSIPPSVEHEYDTIRGTLKCTKCRETIGVNGCEIYRHPDKGFIDYYSTLETDVPHVCMEERPYNVDWLLKHGVKFPYDFSSPLTVKEQMTAWIRDGGTLPQTHAYDAHTVDHVDDQPTHKPNKKARKKEPTRQRTMFDD